MFQIKEMQLIANRPTKNIIKLTDFELSKVESPTANLSRSIPQEQVTQNQAATTPVYSAPETLNWMAPEVIEHGKVCLLALSALTLQQNCYTTHSDCYSLGMVLWEILTCCVPFDEPGL